MLQLMFLSPTLPCTGNKQHSQVRICSYISEYEFRYHGYQRIIFRGCAPGADPGFPVGGGANI